MSLVPPFLLKHGVVKPLPIFKKFLTCRLSRKFAIKRLLLQIAPHLAYTATLPDVVLPDSSPSGCVTKREMIGRPRVCCLHTISDISPIQFNWNFTKAKGVETATCIEVKCKSWQWRMQCDTTVASVPFCSSAILDPRVSNTIDVLSPFIPVLCHSDWLFHGESCTCMAWCCPPRLCLAFFACVHLALFLALSLSLQATPLFPHGVTVIR